LTNDNNIFIFKEKYIFYKTTQVDYFTKSKCENIVISFFIYI